MDLPPISPNTAAQYERILARAFQEGLPRSFGEAPTDLSLRAISAEMPASCRALLRAALKRKAAETGVDPSPWLAQVPKPHRVRRAPSIPVEDEMIRYEAEARKLPVGSRAMALLPLAVGLRASTTLALRRDDVKRGVQHGELRVLLKGAREVMLPCTHAKGLLEELLDAPAAEPSTGIAEARRPRRRRAWALAGDILSAGKPITQYHALHALIRDAGERADIVGLRPHKLRHAFATRMLRDGAAITTIQFMLGHSDLQTTLIYLHGDGSLAAKHLRTF